VDINRVICLRLRGMAQTEPSTEQSSGATTQADRITADDKITVTHHSLTLGDAKIDYQALAGR